MTEAGVAAGLPDSGGRSRPRIRADLLDQLDLCGDLPSRPGALGLHALEGPLVEPRTLLNVVPGVSGALDSDVFVWETDQERWFGWGAAHKIVVAGDDRFSMVREACERAEVVSLSAGQEVDREEPRWFGGFAFEAEQKDGHRSPRSAAWRPFGDGVFVLPRFAAVRRGDQKVRWFVVLDRSDRENPCMSRTVLLLSHVWNAVEAFLNKDGALPEQAAGPLAKPHLVPSSAENGLDPWVQMANAPVFEERIKEVVALIQSGGAQKIVAADQRVVKFARSPDLETVMGLWAERAPESTRFLFCRGGSAFLGATPERLVQLVGRQVRSPALAGTLPKRRENDVSPTRRQLLSGESAGVPEELEERLLGNAKEQHEHEFVVRHIVQRLEPMCRWVRVAERPEVLELHDLFHLKTVVEGELKSAGHVLDIVAQLHPTPAVCGLPAKVASQWIQQREVASRGWYSGPVGWFDAQGNGDFHVALRSMLLSVGEGEETQAEGGWTQARLFAGVGLVAGSVAAQEQIEVAAKLLTAGRTLRRWLEPSATIEPTTND